MHSAPVGIHCPVCAGEMREGRFGESAYRTRVRAQRNPTLRRATGLSVTKTLLAVNVAVALLMLTTGAPTSPRTLLRFGALPPVVPSDQWWRLLTAMFVHIGIAHLAFNMFALWLFGQTIEARFGRIRFIALYLGSGLLGSAASLTFTHGGIRAGASGGVFGILGAWIAIYLLHRAHPGARDQLKSLFVLVGINLFFGFSVAGIDNAAHLGGLAAGVLIGLGVEVARGRRPAAWRLAGLTGYGIVLVTAILMIGPNVV